jgi:hypothetical protein
VRLADCVIVWCPDSARYPQGFRGKARIFPAPGGEEAWRTHFPCVAGRVHEQAHHPDSAARSNYIMRVAATMVSDGLVRSDVHRLLLRISEYRAAVAPQFLRGATR